IETLDGFKFRVKDGWLMFRPSGTEPVLRIYSEAPETWSHIEGMLFALYPDVAVWMGR
ncbi:MAG: hypothetical protein HKN04_12715, partial [Rhodothermaceae bacterium]|nr:hypothetical protein [Rhodothermaceae bacterium]